MHLIRSFARILVVATLMSTLAGCPSLVRPPPPTPDNAAALSRAGDHAAAARMYEALADENPGPQRTDFLLRAAGAWLRAQSPESADRALAGLDAALAPAQSFERSLLQAQSALDRHQPSAAWAALAAAREPTAAPDADRYLALRERAAFATGRAVEGVRAQISRERWMSNPAMRAQSRATLLRELRDASEHGAKPEPQATQDTVVRGWLEIGDIAAAMARSPVAATPLVDAWRQRYPGHPANGPVRTELLGEPAPVGPAGTIAHVALLLPITGKQAGAAAAVQNGFFAAANRVPEAVRPAIRVYDTTVMSVADAISQANAEGAEFIVGPLARDELVAAADYASAHPPILALNFLPADHAPPGNFYQFALSPEDEARQVAQRILAHGMRRGVALAPAGDWGDRVVTAFNQELTAGGGELLASAGITSRADFSTPITGVLRINESRARARRLEALLGTSLAFEPRRRPDVQFIFAPAPAPIARLLRPQFRFHYAGETPPMFATSDAYDPHPTANADLEGLMFPDMPWMLGTGPLVREVRDSTRAEARDASQDVTPADAGAGTTAGAPLNSNVDGTGTAPDASAASAAAAPPALSRRGRLFAFGFDAYNLCAAIRNGGTPRIDGLTGHLTLGADGRVRRELDWARMRGGQPELIDHSGD
ncbi:MAG: penicillin-binding protein activator [Steroidobacteraceae bacterium]